MPAATDSPDLRHELGLLALSHYPLVLIEGSDEDEIERLVAQVASDLDLPLMGWTSTRGLVRRGSPPLPDTREPEKALAKILDMEGELLALFRDLHPFFERPEVVRHLRECESRWRSSRTTLVLSGHVIELPPELLPSSSRLELPRPTGRDLERLVRQTARELAQQRRSRIELEEEDYPRLAGALRGLHLQEARRALYAAALEDGRLDAADFPRLLESRQRKLQSDAQLEWMEPLSGLADLGGAPSLKRWIERRTDAFGEAARLFGVEAPRGLLMVGVPGTGKSLACRALAGEWSLPLLRLDPGRLYDKYVGETEANLRRALGACEALAPAVLWLDEIEKALAAGGSEDGGVSQRVLGTLLTWMQERSAPVFVVATSNDVQRLPVELLRRGRFDEVFFVDLPPAEERASIFAIHLAKRRRDPKRFALDELAAATEGFSGAEIEGVVVAGLYHAFSESQELSDRVLHHEILSTRPLSQLRPEAISALREWGRHHATLA